MELRVLNYFLAVAREQNISAAAESLHLSQPTLSRQLKELEEELGKQLFIRGNRKITLTDEGMILRKRAEEISELVRKTEDEITQSDETVAGNIYIGAGETDAVRLIAKAAKKIQEQYPLIRIHIMSGDAVTVTEQLDSGLADFCLVFGEIDMTRYDGVSVPAKDSWGVLMRKDSSLAQQDSIEAKDLWDKPLIVSRQAIDGEQLQNWLVRDKDKLDIAATYTLLYNGSIMVEEGMGYALGIDKLINTTGDSTLTFRPFSPPLEMRTHIIWKKYQVLTKAASLFLQILRETAEEERPEQ